MKILVVQDYLRSGGTERQAILLSGAFADAGHEVTLLTFRPCGALAETVREIVVHEALQPFDLRLDWLAPGLFAAAQRIAPDIVLCLGRMANCYAGRLQSALTRAVVISTMRTGKRLPWLYRRSLRQTRHVVANSREARDALVRDHAIPAEKISVIYNSLVFSGGPASTASSDFRLRHSVSSTTFVLLCVAMFRPEKNQRELIEIVADLRPELDCQLWLAGDGPERANCEQLASERGISDRVKFFGFQRDPSALYAAADLAVHASSSEALSNFLIEAQAHGLPAVAYAAQGIAECFVPAASGFVIPRGDRAAFRTRVLALASDPALRRQFSAAARDYARANFDPSRQVAMYLELFQKLTSSPS